MSDEAVAGADAGGDAAAGAGLAADVVADVVAGADAGAPLRGRVAIVTGGNGGIGLGIATGLAAAGADVAVWGTNQVKNFEASRRLRTLGTRVHVERCDVSDEHQVDAAFAATLAALGRVDAVVANAGIPGTPHHCWELPLAEWRRVTAVDLDGAFLTLRAGARHMVAGGQGGALVAVGSIAAIHGDPTGAAYCAAKAGIMGLVRSMAVDLARHRVRVNALLPGWTGTDLIADRSGNERFVAATVGRTPVRRWADPTEYGAAAAYLADPRHTFHTGDALVVDGGYTIY